MSRAVPIVVVLGATGAGKSKLALEIAHKFGGEIISADAMQMYKGLDIITNKVTPEERQLVKHHMIDFHDPLLKSTVVDFRNQAVPIVDDLLKQKVMPVICGGTNYYIESLLWNVLVEKAPSTVEPLNKKQKTEVEGLEQLSSQDLYKKLQEVDPERAQQLHPNEERKILRSLQVFHRECRKHSEILAEQRQMSGGGLLGGGLRYPKEQVAILWVQCEQKTLDERCDKRVNKMIAAGLIPELQGFHDDFNAKRGSNSYDEGIFQSIGFKEFHQYLLMDKEAKESTEGQKAFLDGQERMMIATRQYARRQDKWIRQRFLRADRQCPPVFGVDSTDPSKWATAVQEPAFRLVESFMNGQEPALKALPLNQVAHSFEDSRQMYECSLCDLNLKGRLQFEQHLKSKRHKRVASSVRIRVRLQLLEGINDDDKDKSMAVLKDSTRLALDKIKAAFETDDDVVELRYPIPSLSHSFEAHVNQVKERLRTEVGEAKLEVDFSLSTDR